MATRNVNLTHMLDEYVEERIQSGAFQNASEVVRDALRLHKARSERDARKLQRFLALVQEGMDELEAGRFEDIDDLGGWFDALEAEVDTAARENPQA